VTLPGRCVACGAFVLLGADRRWYDGSRPHALRCLRRPRRGGQRAAAQARVVAGFVVYKGEAFTRPEWEKEERRRARGRRYMQRKRAAA
jgi:hypothetical protein